MMKVLHRRQCQPASCGPPEHALLESGSAGHEDVREWTGKWWFEAAQSVIDSHRLQIRHQIADVQAGLHGRVLSTFLWQADKVTDEGGRSRRVPVKGVRSFSLALSQVQEDLVEWLDWH